MEIISRELIKPSSPTPRENRGFKLSLLDQLVPHKYFSLLFFHQNQSSSSENLDPSEVTLQLKQSLSQTLTLFNILAGKLNPDYLSVDCDDSGALFVEAKVDASLSESAQNAPYESFNQYLPFELCDDDGNGKILGTYPKDEMLLAAQISWFKCGGNAIGVCISHKVADFMSLVEFLNSWATINRGDCKRLSPNFDLGRNLFPQRDLPHRSLFAELKGKISCRRFLFNKEKLTELKELAISSSSSFVKNPTRVEVVTAFLLKQLINVERVKNANQSAAETKLIMLRHMVNLRSRLSSLASSNLNEEFPFGNFSIAPSSVFDPDENSQEDFRAFGDLVALINTTIKKANYDYVMNFVTSLSNSGASNGKSAAEQQPTIVHFTSWCRFPFYDTDFGWGKPVSVGPAGTPDTIRVILTSTPDEDGIEAWIYRLEDELALLPDELLSLEMTNYFDIESK